MLNRRNVLMSAGALALARPAAAGAAGAAGPPVELAGLMDDMFAQALADSPELTTSLGLDTGDHRAAKSQLHDGSVAAQAARRQRTAEQLARMRAIDRSALSAMAGVNYDSLIFDLDTEVAADRRFTFGDGAGYPYVLSQISGAYQDVPDFLANQHTIETAADAEAYIARLEAFARLMDDEVERVRRDVGLGVTPPDFAIAGALAQLKDLRVEPSKSTLVASLADRAAAKGIAGDWAGRASGVYTTKVVPAIGRQIALLDSLKGQASHEAGVWRLPDGEAYYAASLLSSITVKLSPAEVHQLGLDQTRELSARADLLFRKMGVTQGTVGERYVALFNDPKYLYPNTDAGKAKLIADMNRLVATMRQRLPACFDALPKARVEIQRVPKFIEAGASTHYSEASLDGSRPGIYWLNLRDTAEMPSWDLPTTTYHETIPGHHLQLSLQRQADLPMIRRVQGPSAYIEGWALYAEQLAQEMGAYETDPAGELGYIHDALLRSGRLVVDTGLHSLRWSREKAIATLHEIEGDPLTLAAREIERYSVWPGQACSYMVGKLTWLRLRERAKAALGEGFDIRRFHDAGLLSGAMPLTALETVIDGYVAAARRA